MYQQARDGLAELADASTPELAKEVLRSQGMDVCLPGILTRYEARARVPWPFFFPFIRSRRDRGPECA